MIENRKKRWEKKTGKKEGKGKLERKRKKTWEI